MSKVSQGQFYRHNNDGRIYQVVGAGKNLSNDGEPTVAFRQVLNANDVEALSDGEVNVGTKCYIRSKEDFVDMYSEVEFTPPENIDHWTPVNADDEDDEVPY